MGVSPRVPQARATPRAEGRGCPEDRQCGGCVRPPASSHASLGEEALGSRGAALPRVPCPCPSGRRSTLASLAQTLPGDGSGAPPLDQDSGSGQRCLMLRHCLSSSRSMRL